MDDNTKDVIVALISLISAVITPVIVIYVNKRTNKKVDEYHKAVNGNMEKLLKSTKDLAVSDERTRVRNKK